MISKLVRQSPNPLSPIEYDESVLKFYDEKFYPGIKDKFLTEASTYCKLRDEACTKMLQIKNSVELELKSTFSDMAGVQVLLMSSVGNRTHTHLLAKSDIDFGILLSPLTPTLKQECQTRLENSGYVFSKVIYNYTSYVKIIDQIEIELKIRGATESAHIVRLHEYLDSMPAETQQLLAYAKSETIHDVDLYNKLKAIIYSAAYTRINKK